MKPMPVGALGASSNHSKSTPRLFQDALARRKRCGCDSGAALEASSKHSKSTPRLLQNALARRKTFGLRTRSDSGASWVVPDTLQEGPETLQRQPRTSKELRGASRRTLKRPKSMPSRGLERKSSFFFTQLVHEASPDRFFAHLGPISISLQSL